MKNKVLFQIIIILGLLILLSCKTPKPNNLEPTLMPTILSTKSSTLLIIPTLTPTFWSTKRSIPVITPTDQFQWTDELKDGYISKIPIKKLEGATDEEIVQALITQWLDHYLNDCQIEAYSIRDYTIQSIKIINASWMHEYIIVSKVVYTVKPGRNGAMANMSDEEFENFTTEELMPFGVLIDGDNYRLRLMPGFGT
jgi:hypothetical protein